MEPGVIPGTSVVIPVYNSAALLKELVRRIRAVLTSMGGPFEIVLVNDGSRDESWVCIKELCRSVPEVRGFDLFRNFGQHNALLCGIREAQYDVVVTMDDDLQNPPEELPRMVEKLQEGFDVVYGTPLAERHGLWRDLASRTTKLVLQSVMGAETARSVSAFRVFRTCLRDAFASYDGPYASIDVFLTWGTTRFSSIRVAHEHRQEGESNYTVGKLITHAFNMMTGFSTLPLQVSSVIGFLCTLFGVGVLLLVIGRVLIQGTQVPGFAFLASTIAIFSGAQLLALGIIGEYLARMHFRSMRRPAYVVRGRAVQETHGGEVK